MISFRVEDNQGIQQTIEIPEGISLSLMEVLKASDYPILATCGGMALCATCHVEVLAGPALPEPQDAEFDMLETLPHVYEGSRLSCQIRLQPHTDGLVVRIAG